MIDTKLFEDLQKIHPQPWTVVKHPELVAMHVIDANTVIVAYFVSSVACLAFMEINNLFDDRQELFYDWN